jgi:ankyrin
MRGSAVLACAFTIAAAASASAAGSSALIDAVKSGASERLRAALKPGVDVNAPQGDGATALHWAAHRSDLIAADLLIQAGANVNAVNDLGVSPLWLAAANGNDAMVKRLLDAGANPKLALESGETPLMVAARGGDARTVARLAASGADVNAAEHLRGQTALMWAADQRHPAAIRALLEAGANVHARSAVWRQLENTAGNTNPAGDFEMEHGGSTALLFSARQGDVESARLLLDAGANINDTDAAGTSALVVAAHSNHQELGLFLLSRGADPNAAGAGYTALHAAALRGSTPLARALLDKQARPDDLVVHGSPVRRLSADYSIRHQMIGLNALWIAARMGHLEIVKALLERGASATLTPKDGTTTLKAAMGFVRGVTENREGRYGGPRLEPAEEERLNLELSRVLLDAGVNVNAVDNAGESALFDAARQRFDSVVEFLVSRGADLSIRNKRSQTALTVLLTENYEAPPDSPVLNRQTTIDLLKRLGAQE